MIMLLNVFNHICSLTQGLYPSEPTLSWNIYFKDAFDWYPQAVEPYSSALPTFFTLKTLTANSLTKSLDQSALQQECWNAHSNGWTCYRKWEPGWLSGHRSHIVIKSDHPKWVTVQVFIFWLLCCFYFPVRTSVMIYVALGLTIQVKWWSYFR